ncbi:PfkB family carbohydrate kinase [Actinomadura citrea]|uniref:PfkB family carbohydrate kinase n=1 Tax=Actinomadura citrea TaxID=46158 RepID=UPI002E289F92|nr:PfkB family carbohydrate kinase [Actinomadura citrea]
MKSGVRLSDGPPNGVSDFSIAVIGDIRVETRARLREQSFGGVLYDHLEFTPIDSVLSGTAINFAKQAVRWFGAVRVISRIGQDLHTEEIVSYLSRLATSRTLSISAGAPNGRTIVLRDRDARRILIAGDTSPIQDLSTSDIQRAEGDIALSDAAFADGYLMLAERSRAALLAALRTANDNGTVFCLDLVPHDMEKYLSLDGIRPILERSDIIVSQARTLATLIGLSNEYPYKEQNFGELIPGLAELSEKACWYLRHGDHDIGKVTVCQGGREISRYNTGFDKERSMAGFGDRITAAEIHDYLSRQRTKSS